MNHPKPATVGQLKETGYRPSSVKDELRRNVIRKLKSGGEIFPGIIGYRETVLPQIVNGLLSKHDMLFLGLRGQAKTRIHGIAVGGAGDEPAVHAFGRRIVVAKPRYGREAKQCGSVAGAAIDPLAPARFHACGAVALDRLCRCAHDRTRIISGLRRGSVRECEENQETEHYQAD